MIAAFTPLVRNSSFVLTSVMEEFFRHFSTATHRLGNLGRNLQKISKRMNLDRA